MKVFISYSTDNSALAEALTNTLQALHPPNVVVGIMKNIPYGAEWSQEIEDRLESADVLIAIAASIPRREFAYTGVEIGYFLKSIQQRPEGSTGAKRRVIPVYLTNDPPDVLSRTQGPNFLHFLLRVGDFDLCKPSKEIADQITIDDRDPAYLLLAALEEVAAPTSPISQARKTELIKQAHGLYCAVVEIVRAQPVSEEQPKGKLIVHLPPKIWDIAQAYIEVEGSLIQMLTAEEGGVRYTWAG